VKDCPMSQRKQEKRGFGLGWNVRIVQKKKRTGRALLNYSDKLGKKIEENSKSFKQRVTNRNLVGGHRKQRFRGWLQELSKSVTKKKKIEQLSERRVRRGVEGITNSQELSW